MMRVAGVIRSVPLSWLLAACASLLALPVHAFAQRSDASIRVELAVEPERVTVGDPFHAALRVIPPTGYLVEYGEVVSGDTLQAIAPVSLTGDAGADTPRTAIYPLVAWVAGTPLRATVDVRFTAPDGTVQTRPVELQLPEVVSVLPAEGEDIVPKPPKDLVDPGLGGLPWWWWLLLLLGALLAAWLAYRYLKRPELGEVTDPREWALAQLDQSVANLLRAGRLAESYQRASWVVRSYIHHLHPDLGLDLTTTELLDLFEPESTDSDPVRSLSLLLLAADRVKFARHLPAAGEATANLADTRAWVMAYPPPVIETENRSAA